MAVHAWNLRAQVKQRQEGSEHEASLSYTGSPILKKKKETKRYKSHVVVVKFKKFPFHGS